MDPVLRDYFYLILRGHDMATVDYLADYKRRTGKSISNTVFRVRVSTNGLARVKEDLQSNYTFRILRGLSKLLAQNDPLISKAVLERTSTLLNIRNNNSKSRALNFLSQEINSLEGLNTDTYKALINGVHTISGTKKDLITGLVPHLLSGLNSIVISLGEKEIYSFVVK